MSGHSLCSFHLQLPALVIGHRRSQLLIIPNTTNSRFSFGHGRRQLLWQLFVCPNITEPIAGAELLLFHYDTNRRSLVGSENGVCFHGAISWCKLRVSCGSSLDVNPRGS